MLLLDQQSMKKFRMQDLQLECVRESLMDNSKDEQRLDVPARARLIEQRDPKTLARAVPEQLLVS